MRVRLTTRVIAPTVLVSLLMLLVGGVAAWYLHRLQQDSSALICSSVKRLRAAEELQIVGQEERNLANRYLVSGDRELLKRAEARRADVDHWIGEAARLAGTAREKELIEQLRQGFEHFFVRLRGDRRRSEGRPPKGAVAQACCTTSLPRRSSSRPSSTAI